jgi:hypothetical protein
MSKQYTTLSRDYYPYVTRAILRLMDEGKLTQVTHVDVEPNYGYVTRLTYQDGSYRITYGNDLGLNNAAAYELAKDKGHTKFILRTMNVNCPEGAEFISPWWEEVIGQSQRVRGNVHMKTTRQAAAYVETERSYPVYVKPVDGSRGGDIFKVATRQELEAVLETYNEKRIRVAMIEAPITLPDYRIVVLDGKLISAYHRLPLTVVGDGTATIEEHITRLQQHHEDTGRDTRLRPDDDRIYRHLAQQHMTVNDILPDGQSHVLVPISNLSIGGTSKDVSDSIDPRWVALAAQIGKQFNLRLLGIDLACEDITSSAAKYSVIEVNAAPGLDHYALSGDTQKELVDQLYVKVLDVPPSRL